ncbi:uncharacterized protein V1518DRAFT_381925 [Limtongia smithiae]|uniref:uncharacterized protein n=1 Tax=Limtongia smithiae TaxID=1125753 RepID=UPI0034CD6563
MVPEFARDLKSLPDDIWALGIYDAHCHVADNYKRLSAARSLVRASKLIVMSTRFHDQDRVHDVAVEFPDWIVPSFGYHPWFTHVLYTTPIPPQDKLAHYRSVLYPEPPEDFLLKLPTPQSLSLFIESLIVNFERHPNAILGEVGIDKSFRLLSSGDYVSFELPDNTQGDFLLNEGSDPCLGDRIGLSLSPYRVQIAHQKDILLAQLRVAAKYRRPASIHGVQAHGILYDTIKVLWENYPILSRKKQKREEKEAARLQPTIDDNSAENTQPMEPPPPFPERICLHSYTGPPDQIALWTNSRRVPIAVYFSFSVAINSRFGEKFKQVVRIVPQDRLLIESDFHVAGETMEGLLASIVLFVCEVRGWELKEGVQILGENYKRFLYG